jgi:hypothetical protein
MTSSNMTEHPNARVKVLKYSQHAVEYQHTFALVEHFMCVSAILCRFLVRKSRSPCFYMFILYDMFQPHGTSIRYI